MEYDLIVIGAGPGGYVAAIRAAQLGLKVACVEKEAALGGTCLRVGCIPSKALLESTERLHAAQHEFLSHGILATGVSVDLGLMMKRKDHVVATLTQGVAGLLKKNKITHFVGQAQIAGQGRVNVMQADGMTPLSATNVIIATGSHPVSLRGVELDGNRLGTSTEALSYPEIPQHLIVIGAGVIGLELGSVWKRLGSKVTVIEYHPRILPGLDADIAKDALKIFEKQGIEFRLGRKVTAARVEGETVVVEVENEGEIRGDRVLVAVGRKPNTEGLGLDVVGIQRDSQGRILVDVNYKTTAPGFFAIGDVIPGPMLAHKAEEEGVACVEFIVTGHAHVDYNTIPSVIYTHPEIASVGQTEEQLNAGGVKYRKGVFPFRGNGRAQALGDVVGKVKILADATTDRVLGVHIIGPRAGDLIAEATVSMAFGASSEDIARVCHAHPTLSETLKEAALAVEGRAIHQ